MYLYRAIPGIADTPAEVITATTEHGGDQPYDRLVICGYREDGHLVAALPVALDAPVCERIDRIRETISHLARMDLTACAIVGYGTPLYGTTHRLITGLNAHGITVPLALYLTGGYCHSYLLDDWPEEGTPYPPAPTTTEDTEDTEDTLGNVDAREFGENAATPGTQLQRLVLDAPYGPATANIEADPANLQVTYKIATDTIGLLVTIEPEHGDGHHAIPYGADLHITCNDTHDTITVAAVAIAAISHGGETVTFPASLLPDAGIDRPLLSAVLRAVIHNWANRPDTCRLQLRSAARTAAARLPHAQQLLTERQADLDALLTELDDLHHVIGELRGLATEHRNKPRRSGPDSGAGPLPYTPVERAGRAARAVAVHARHTDSGITTDDLYIPALAGCAVTNLLTDLLFLLFMVGIDPGEVMAAASEVYETEQAEHTGNH